jgi:SsrA-binding protein
MSKKPDKQEAAGNFLVCRNAKALARYTVDERFESGMVLLGSEAKSLRERRGDLDGSYARVEKGELYLYKMYVAPYAQATAYGHDPKRTRKLLVHRHELEKLTGKLALRGYTLLPIQVYFKNGRAKIELGLAKAKDVGDKREDLKRKAELREVRAAVDKGRRR